MYRQRGRNKKSCVERAEVKTEEKNNTATHTVKYMRIYANACLCLSTIQSLPHARSTHSLIFTLNNFCTQKFAQNVYIYIYRQTDNGQQRRLSYVCPTFIYFFYFFCFANFVRKLVWNIFFYASVSVLCQMRNELYIDRSRHNCELCEQRAKKNILNAKCDSVLVPVQHKIHSKHMNR